MPTPMTGTRLGEDMEQRLAASVERRGVKRSDWLREVIANALAAENQAADNALTILDMTKRFSALERDIRAIKESLHELGRLSNSLAVERAADRAVAQQIYRMTFRAAYLVVKQFTDEVSEEQRDDLGMGLCAEADDLCHEIGLTRLEREMREAREELRQSLERGGTS